MDTPIPSPCRQACELDADGVCLGCGRTIAEIVAWPAMTEEEKAAVWARLGAGQDLVG